MRLMLACAAAAAVAFAAPAFAQEAAPSAAPMTTTPSKPKAGTTAYCNTLKSTSSKTACLKRVHASAAKPATGTTHKAKAKKPSTDPMAAPKQDTSAQLTPPMATTPTPVQQAQPSTIIVPPLPQKTI